MCSRVSRYVQVWIFLHSYKCRFSINMHTCIRIYIFYIVHTCTHTHAQMHTQRHTQTLMYGRTYTYTHWKIFMDMHTVYSYTYHAWVEQNSKRACNTVVAYTAKHANEHTHQDFEQMLIFEEFVFPEVQADINSNKTNHDLIWLFLIFFIFPQHISTDGTIWDTSQHNRATTLSAKTPHTYPKISIWDAIRGLSRKN